MMMSRARTLLVAGMAAIAILFVVLELAGGRACVGVLSGTLPARDLDAVLGLAYVASWFAVVLVVPVVALAMILDGVCGSIERWRAGSRR